MITDLRLPDMQGSDLLKAMAAEEIVSFPPVIVYTGRNLTRDEETELQRYSRSIIIKGARSPERLLDEVTLFLHKVEAELSSERQGMLKTARGRDRIFEGRTILLVDDDVRNIFALTSALEQRGAAVEIGRNGREALEKLDQVREIDLVLMDVMMPEMDGLEATRRMRADPRFEKMPVIAITAKAMKDDREQCLAAGANDYLAKPVDLERLFSLLRVWMPKMERLDTEIELRLLMEAIYLKYSYDFRNYTVASQKRRVLHALEQLGLPSISALQDRVLREPALFGRLPQFVTISV
eukprot:gene10054-13542_t